MRGSLLFLVKGVVLMLYTPTDEQLSYLRTSVIKCVATDGSGNNLVDCRPYHLYSARNKIVVRVNLSRFFLGEFCTRYDNDSMNNDCMKILSKFILQGYLHLSEFDKENVSRVVKTLYDVDNVFKDKINHDIVFSSTSDSLFSILCNDLNKHLNAIYNSASRVYFMSNIGMYFDLDTKMYYGYYCYSLDNTKVNNIVLSNSNVFEVVGNV